MVLVAPPPARPRSVPAGARPRPRGPVSRRLLAALAEAPHDLGRPSSWPEPADTEDLQLALYCCYELHYRGFAAVDADWEWEPSLLALRRRLEETYLDDLYRAVGRPSTEYRHPDAVVARLWETATSGGGPSLSGWVAERATIEHLREFAIHRSAYQLKEADPHTWAIPRIGGRAKAAMVTIQADEYGGGDAFSMHAALFARTMTALGLDPAASHLDRIPAVTLATTNLVSMLGLHRRWRGALVGHLALFEMTSTGPMSRYAAAMRRLGVAESGCRFYDVHVEADRVHQHVAADGMVAGLLEDEPELGGDVLWGAAALSEVEGRMSGHILCQWEAGRSSLRPVATTPA